MIDGKAILAELLTPSSPKPAKPTVALDRRINEAWIQKHLGLTYDPDTDVPPGNGRLWLECYHGTIRLAGSDGLNTYVVESDLSTEHAIQMIEASDTF